jgi:hypothetical protein
MSQRIADRRRQMCAIILPPYSARVVTRSVMGAARLAGRFMRIQNLGL